MKIYERAVKRWGIKSQLGMLQEECAELIAAVNKYWRGKSIDLVIDELVDVEIMIEQMRYIFPKDEWQARRIHKLRRLRRTLDERDEST